MTHATRAALIAGSLAALAASPALAFYCPSLVKDCQATADAVAKRDGSDKEAVTKARQGCEEAMKLHQEGKHKDSMIRAGEAITAASRALK